MRVLRGGVLLLLGAFVACDAGAPEPTDALVPLMKDQGLNSSEDAGTPLEGGVSDAEPLDLSGEELGPCGERSPRAGELASCGSKELIACRECNGLEQCGAGMSNFVPIVNCANCPGRVDSHVCEAGSCRILGAPGALRVRFSVPSQATGARSFIAIAFNPTTARGDRLRCAELVSSCQLTNNPELNATNVAFQLFSSPADPGLIYVTTFGGEAGEDRLVLLIVTAEASGGGEVLGTGCVENVTVGTDAPTEIAIDVQPF